MFYLLSAKFGCPNHPVVVVPNNTVEVFGKLFIDTRGENRRWHEAAAHCNSQGGRLAEFRTEQDLRTLYAINGEV